MTHGVSPLGLGIYAREEAARLIGVTPSRLRRWVNGYTYHYVHGETSERRRRPPVVATDLPVMDQTVALSFVELMELRVVAALRAKGASLQEIRRAGDVAAEHFGTSHPFASKRVYTDGRKVFAALCRQSNSDLVQLTRGVVGQVIAGGILEPFLSEIDFDEDTKLTARWWPLGKQVPVVLDPKVAFGAPVIQGTRLRTDFIADMAVHSAPAEIALIYHLDAASVEAAMTFQVQLKAA